MSGPKAWGISPGLGLITALLGYRFLTVLLGLGDEDTFDWVGAIAARVFAVPVVTVASWIVGRVARSKAPRPRAA